MTWFYFFLILAWLFWRWTRETRQKKKSYTRLLYENQLYYFSINNFISIIISTRCRVYGANILTKSLSCVNRVVSAVFKLTHDGYTYIGRHTSTHININNEPCCCTVISNIMLQTIYPQLWIKYQDKVDSWLATSLVDLMGLAIQPRKNLLAIEKNTEHGEAVTLFYTLEYGTKELESNNGNCNIRCFLVRKYFSGWTLLDVSSSACDHMLFNLLSMLN